jgi:HYDIN/CFA65/VesB-like, Ig-like domain/Abnormal spindle-like microcephaly-assoc'd, ASPM-SPD-2-Hydin
VPRATWPVAVLLVAAAAGRPSAAAAAPSLSIEPAAVDFGSVAVGSLAEATVLFRNTGDADLRLGTVSVDDPAFDVGGPSGGVPPGTVLAAADSLAVPLAFRPAAVGPASASLRVSSNDPAAPERVVALTGSGAAGPVIGVSPGSFAETLNLDETVTRDLVIRNTGDLALDWTLSVRPAVPGLRGSLQGVRVAWDRSKGQISTLPWSTLVGELEARGAVVDEVMPGSGDVITTALLASYRVYISADVQSGWSAAEASALSAWVQAGGGVLIIGDNLQSRPYYNSLLSALGTGITVGSTWGGDTVLSGSAIRSHPSTAGVTRVRVGLSPRILAVATPAEVVVQANVSDPLVAVASRGVGRVAMVGDELFDDVTIAEADGTYAAQNRLFANQLVDWLAGGLWLKSDLAAGTVASGDSAVAHLLFDATDRPGGTFDADVRIASSDATTPTVDVPARLTVIGVPEIGVSPAALAFPDTPEGGSATDTLRVHDPGTEVLHVSGVASSSAEFVVPTASFQVAPGDSAALLVTFYPDSIGAFAGTITITSDAGGDPSLAIGASGRGVVNCGSACPAPSLRPADVVGSQGFELWVEVDLHGNPQPVSALGFDLHFDPGQLVFLDAWQADPLITLADAQETSPGIVRVGAFASPAVPAAFDGSLLQLSFRVDCPSCAAGDHSDLYVSGLVDDLAGIRPCCGLLTLAACPSGHGDVNADSTLSATDALCALRIWVNGGQVPPGGSCDVNGDCEVAAADVNCNGTVSPADALALYERVLCVADPVPLSCFAVSDPDPCGTGGRRAGSSLAFGPVEATPDGWAVSIASSATPAAFGLEIALPDGAELVRVEPGEAAAGWAALETAATPDGRIRIGGLAGTAPTGIAGTVARIVGRGGNGGEVRVADAVDATFDAPLARALPEASPREEGIRAVHPNPTTGAVAIELAASAAHVVRHLRVHDVTGRLVRDLGTIRTPDGSTTTTVGWDGRDDRGKAVSAGIYFVVLRLDGHAWTRKVLLVR